jgi:hypothetical protein
MRNMVHAQQLQVAFNKRNTAPKESIYTDNKHTSSTVLDQDAMEE